VVVAVGLLLAGCGTPSAPVATAPLEDGSFISPQRFLADVSAAAEAVSDVAAAIRDAGPAATPSGMAAVSEALVEPLGRARLMAQRLAAARLEDRRLEEERARVVPALSQVVSATDDLVQAARAGDAQRTVTAGARLATAVEALRTAGSG
jgi:hypothetical protein